MDRSPAPAHVPAGRDPRHDPGGLLTRAKIRGSTALMHQPKFARERLDAHQHTTH